MAKAKTEGKNKFRVTGSVLNEPLIEVILTAKTAQEAKDEALKKEPGLAKCKDVQVYKRPPPTGWVRVA